MEYVQGAQAGDSVRNYESELTTAHHATEQQQESEAHQGKRVHRFESRRLIALASRVEAVGEGHTLTIEGR